MERPGPDRPGPGPERPGPGPERPGPGPERPGPGPERHGPERPGPARPARLLLLCLLLLPPVPAQVRHPLPVLWVMPVTAAPGGGNLTAALAPAVRLALQDLQRQPPPLGNYEIQLQLLDSQCDPAASLKALFDGLWGGPRYLLVFGGVCPVVTALLARSLPALRLVQVSFAASSPSLSNRRWFGNLFSLLPSDRVLNQAAVRLLQRLRWTRVGVVTADGPGPSEMERDLLRQLQRAGVQVVSSQRVSGDACSGLRRLKELDARIIVGLLGDAAAAAEVFCCAYRLNLFGARYQWITVGVAAGAWTPGGRGSGCSDRSLLTAADGAIGLQTRRLGATDTPGVSGRTPRDYEDSYLRQVTQEGSEVSPLHTFAYDAVWLAARALSHVTEAAKRRQKFSSQNESVGEDDAHRTLLEAVRRSSFQGVSGPVFFRNGERMTTIELTQQQGSTGVLVGEFNTSSQQLRLTSRLLRFTGPGPPRDRTLVLVQRRHVSLLLYAIVSSAAAVTIIITVTLLCLSVCTKHWPLRSRGGSQDRLLLLGILLSSSSVLTSGLDGASLPPRTSEVLCSVGLWTLSVGHTLGFAALFVTAWRRHSARGVTPQPAGGVLLWMLLLDALVLTSWTILDPLRWVELQHGAQGDPAGRDVEVRPYSERCSSTNMELWLTALYGYKGPLLGLGCFLAWSIRAEQLDPPAVSSKHLSLSVLAVTASSVSGAAGSLLTSHNPPVQFCLTSALILGCDALTLIWLFGPKLLSARWGGSELQPDAAEADGDGDDDDDEQQLRTLNRQLKGVSAQLDVQLETLSMQLCERAAGASLQRTPRNHGGGAATWTHVVQVCPGEKKPSSPDSINSPEQLRRRLSVTLPILHHAYLPAVGGVSASSSGLSGSQEAFVHC